jgi:hypothetical protein
MPALKLNTGEAWEPLPEDVEQWQQLYPAVNVPQELNAMAGWLDANPTRRKTPKGIKRFCNSWLSRAQDKGGSPMVRDRQPADGTIIKTRDMTIEDELSHNFTSDPEMREYFLERYGQCFENGKRLAQ